MMGGIVINRWILRRQRKILLYSIVAFLIMVTYIALFQEDIQIRESQYQPLTERCLSSAAHNLLETICRNYTQGLAYGGFCPNMCIDKSVKIDQCIHHSTTYVLIGRDKGAEIVMKTKRPTDVSVFSKYFEEEASRGDSFEHIQQAYVDRLREHIRSQFGLDSWQLFEKHLEVMSHRIYSKNISELTFEEMKASWSVLGQDELIMAVLHQKLNSFPRLIGICGPLYVIERTYPFSDYFPEFIPSLSWDKRVTIALGFLDLVKDFRRTEIGPLYHCDVQEGNFGLTKNFSVKAIDMDLIHASKKMNELLSGADCVSDKDCDFFDCLSKCDVTKRRCTSKTLTNNLQVICRDIFLPQWPSTGLLSYYKPSHVKAKLNSLLETCRSKGFGSLLMDDSRVSKMIKDLEDILTLSLKTMKSF